MTTPIDQLHTLGQSVWYDNIERRLLQNGELSAMVARGEIRGLTSNPSIFNNAIAKSRDYDAQLISHASAGWSSEELYEQLVVSDIRSAATLLRPLYDQTDGGDGYVSLEVSPRIAHDQQATAEEALRLWDLVDRPNLMVKIPATREGLPAVRSVIAAGVNVNVTLIFSLARYRQVMEAYLTGLEDRLASGGDISRVASVASFFVSRIDAKVDPQLAALAQRDPSCAERARSLQGKLAIANARLAYREFLQVTSTPRWFVLKAQGARAQRPLWASTSTKNPAYPDTMYVDSLIGPDTVNTIPPATLKAFQDHGVARVTIGDDLEGSRRILAELTSLGISVDQATLELEDEGVKAFAQAYESLLAAIEAKAKAAASV